MRGKGRCTSASLVSKGITPAYAGKSPALRPEFATEQDHPRLCGEKKNVRSIERKVIGSPPPMRGKVYVNGLKLIPNRITPAYAGKSAECFPIIIG